MNVQDQSLTSPVAEALLHPLLDLLARLQVSLHLLLGRLGALQELALLVELKGQDQPGLQQLQQERLEGDFSGC